MTAVHPRVAVSQISSWTWSVAEDLAFYREAGIHTVGVALRKLDEPGTADQLAEAGFAWSDVIGVGSRRVAEGLALAARLGAPMVVLTTGPAGPVPWEAAADRFAETMGPLVDQARTAGVGLTLEHTNSLRADVGFVHSLRDAIDLARRVDLGVCVEVNACWGERDLAGTIADGIDRIRLVQVSDYAIGTTSTPDRLVPGDGDIPLARILGQLLAAGYDGVFELELVGPRIDAEGYRSAITRSVRYLSALLTDLGA
ncbi:MAG: sugar phosphate isomerase/epimerase family protein [Acidimicrobiales bacterium]